MLFVQYYQLCVFKIRGGGAWSCEHQALREAARGAREWESMSIMSYRPSVRQRAFVARVSAALDAWEYPDFLCLILMVR